MDIFLTVKVLEDTPAVLSLGKLCDDHGYSYEWINGQKPHLIKNGIRIQCNTENFVPIVVPQFQGMKLIILIILQQSYQAKVWIDKYGETRILLKNQKS